MNEETAAAQTFKDPVLDFIAQQLTRIERKVDGLDDRLRTVEIGLVQKVEIEKLTDRIGKLENFKAKLIGYGMGFVIIAQIVIAWIGKKFGILL